MSQRDDDGAMFFLRALDEVDARPAPMTKRANAALPPKPAREGLQAHDMTPMAKKAPKATTATGPTPLSPAQKPPVANIADKAKTAGDILRIARAATIPTKTFTDISKLASALLEGAIRPAQRVKTALWNSSAEDLVAKRFHPIIGKLAEMFGRSPEEVMQQLNQMGASAKQVGIHAADAAAGGVRSLGQQVMGLPKQYLGASGALGALGAGPGQRIGGAGAGIAGGSLGRAAGQGVGDLLGRLLAGVESMPKGQLQLPGFGGPTPAQYSGVVPSASSLASRVLGGLGQAAGAYGAGRMMRAPAAPPAPPPGALERLLASLKANPGMAAAGAGAAGLGAYGLHRALSGSGQDQ